jgi:predicted metal-dependent hydrolase
VELEERIAVLPGGSLPYLLRRSSRSRGLRVTIDRERGVVVSVPVPSRRGWAGPEREIARFLAERERWVRRHLDRQARERATVVARGGVADGALVRFRGELHRLRVVPAPPRRRTSVTREPGDSSGAAPDELVVTLAASERRSVADVLVGALRARARVAVDREISRHAAALGVTPASVTIRDTRTRWGSASRRGALSFCWRLVLAPPEALEPVGVHELAHLRVFGHGPRFWALVASRRADHAAWRRWLREHSYELHAAFADVAVAGEAPERDVAFPVEPRP